MRKINQLNDNLKFKGIEFEESSLSNFLVWAFSDLCDDVIKGIFAEWTVAKILDIPTTRRYEWANSDLVSLGGVRIEIKASSYWQSWKAIQGDGTPRDLNEYPIQPDSKIRFSGLMAKDTINHHLDKSPRLKSDIYIFCFQFEKNYDHWNAMDLSQWEFYFVAAQELKYKSASLAWLKKQNFGPLSPTELKRKYLEFEKTYNSVTVGESR